MSNKEISTKPYKGVRDFYPQDWMFQKWMFWKMAEVCERFGYENYNASPLEATELYEAKSGSEMINNETYNLIDRGDRRVTIRPEMTPTVARMIADRARELPKPIRWYSIPNLFRYERPQRGRLREHYQLNVDIFGIPGVEADVEVIQIGSEVMKNLGAQTSDFKILINNRKIINSLFSKYTDIPEEIYTISKLIDKKSKLNEEEFRDKISEVLGDKTPAFIDAIENTTLENASSFANQGDIERTTEIIRTLAHAGITNVYFDLTLMRGFDYYTDTVFEFYDTDPANNRSLFGGGRYDDLLDIFGMEKMPAVGFGMGDVTAKDFLETHGIMPKLYSHTKVYVGCMSKESLETAQALTDSLRESGVNTELDFSYRKYDRLIDAAEKKQVPFFIAVGEDESTSQQFNIKQIMTGEITEDVSMEQISELLS